MAFTINQTGIERGATQLVFGTAPIILERHAEDAQDAAYALAIDGTPVTVQFNRAQPKSFLRIRLRLVAGSDVDTLISLLNGSGPVTVKLTPGSATTIQCVFGPRSEQEWEEYNGPYATGQPDGSAVPALLKQYRVDLFLLRL